MIALGQAVVVEGRYDKIKLDSVVDGIVVTTDGFNIFRDTDKQRLLKRLAEETGLIVLTDSDDAGFRIRRYVADIAGGSVFHAYIPEQQGKERRKARPGAAGLIGVEGFSGSVIEASLRRCVAAHALNDSGAREEQQGRQISVADLYEDGLSGTPDAAARRAAFLRQAGLPGRLSTRAMLDILNRLYGYDGYRDLLAALMPGG